LIYKLNLFINNKMENIDIHKVSLLFTIKKNQLKMVKRRGYNIEREEALLEYTLDDFLENFLTSSKETSRSILTQYSPYYENDEGDRLVVYFPDARKGKDLGVEEVNDSIKEMIKYKAKNIIIITPNPLSSTARKKVEELPSYHISVFLDNEMMHDPTEHYLTPEHRALSVEEQRDFLERNKLSIDQLPIINVKDKIVRYYGFRQGQIIEIKRINYYDTMVQNTIAYRAVKDSMI